MQRTTQQPFTLWYRQQFLFNPWGVIFTVVMVSFVKQGAVLHQ